MVAKNADKQKQYQKVNGVDTQSRQMYLFRINHHRTDEYELFLVLAVAIFLCGNKIIWSLSLLL